MTQLTISALVVDGKLRHDVSLTALEGQHVIAAITVLPTGETNEMNLSPPAPEGEFDTDPPEYLQVENDVYFAMPMVEKILAKKPLIVERGTPADII